VRDLNNPVPDCTASTTHGQASAGEVTADGVLASGEADQAGAVDQAVDFDRVAGLATGDWWWSGGTGTFGQ
jgi:hypothetical protein